MYGNVSEMSGYTYHDIASVLSTTRNDLEDVIGAMYLALSTL